MYENKKRFSITEAPKEVLAKIAEIHGIGIIKEFINEYNKELRKRATKNNNYEDIAIEVYKLMMVRRYRIKSAIEEVANHKGISHHTVRRHIYDKFNKKAEKENFYTIGAVIEKIKNISFPVWNQSYKLIDELADLNGIKRYLMDIYHFKYTIEERKANNKYIVDYSKINLNLVLKQIVKGTYIPVGPKDIDEYDILF